MNNIINIAKNTFKETIREKILYAILGFGLLFILSTILFGSVSLGEDLKIIKDLGHAGIYIFSVIITIYLAGTLISKELEKKTIYIILSKPVSTLEFILGKFFGLFASVKLNVLIMVIFYLTVVFIKGGGIDYVSLFSIILLLFELAVLIALAVLFSTFTSPLATTIYSIVVVYIGHSLNMLKDATAKTGGFFADFVTVVYYIMPNLEKFNIRNTVVYGQLPTVEQIIYPIIYAVLFCTILIWLANIALRKQDL